MLGLGELGLGWGLGSWNGLERDQLGVGKIGWELEWISTKRKLGLGFNECLDNKRSWPIGSWSNWEEWLINRCILGTTVLEENQQDIEV